MVTGVLFPALTTALRWPFRHGLALVFVGLLGFSMLRWLAPLVILTCLGVPLLFAIYVWQSGIARGVTRTAMIWGGVVAGIVSAAWWLWAGEVVAREYDVPVAVGSQLQHHLSEGLIATVIGLALTLVPIFVLKLRYRREPGSMEGIEIGAACSLASSAAGTTAWIAPQFATGLLDGYSPWRLFEEAYLYGFVDPVTGVVVGGLVGLTLWYRPDNGRLGPTIRVRRTLSMVAVLSIAVYMGVYLIDAAQLARYLEIAAFSALTAVGLATLQVGMRLAAVHRPRGHVSPLRGSRRGTSV